MKVAVRNPFKASTEKLRAHVKSSNFLLNSVCPLVDSLSCHATSPDLKVEGESNPKNRLRMGVGIYLSYLPCKKKAA